MCFDKKIGIVFGYLAGVLLSTCQVFASEDVVKQCLTASFYPVADDLINNCDVALRAPNLSEMTLADINLHMGSGMLYSHRYDLALGYFKSAIKQNSQLVEAYIGLGMAQYKKGHYLDSVDSLGNALAIDPNNLKAQFELSLHKYDVDRNCEVATTQFQQILEKDPDYYLARYNLAEFYKCSHQSETLGLEETEKLLEVGFEKLSLVPMLSRNGLRDFDLFTRLQIRHAETLANLGKYDLAMRDYDGALSHFPQSDYILVLRANLKVKSNNTFESALEDYEKALLISPNNVDALVGKVRTFGYLKRYSELIKFANYVIQKTPPFETEGWVYYWRGFALKKSGNKSAALQDVKKTILVGTENIQKAIYNSLIQHGYLHADFSWMTKNPPNLSSKEFVNALEACMVDPECY